MASPRRGNRRRRDAQAAGVRSRLPDQTNATLKLLHQVLVSIRIATGNRDLKLAYELADAFEELPMKILRGEWKEVREGFERIYLESLFQSHPELIALRQEWQRVVAANKSG
jgi:hypothetical protein